MVVDADERLHDGIGRRELAALREREEVERILQRQADELLVGPGGDDALSIVSTVFLKPRLMLALIVFVIG